MATFKKDIINKSDANEIHKYKFLQRILACFFGCCDYSQLLRTKWKMHLTDRIGSYVTSFLHIHAVTWREQPPDQMAGRPVVYTELPLSGKIL